MNKAIGVFIYFLCFLGTKLRLHYDPQKITILLYGKMAKMAFYKNIGGTAYGSMNGLSALSTIRRCRRYC
ncbi:MAG: hypothetical protein CR994_04780 [Maribacter sp.]|nr:MAG: hypothetical protein CR994_04780 [Maribacter sp.]